MLEGSWRPQEFRFYLGSLALALVEWRPERAQMWSNLVVNMHREQTAHFEGDPTKTPFRN